MKASHTQSDCRRPKSKLCRICYIITQESKTPCGDPCVEFPGHILHLVGIRPGTTHRSHDQDLPSEVKSCA